MPAYTKLRTLVNALKTGKSHICERLDWWFGDLARVHSHRHFREFSSPSADWSGGPPAWLEAFLGEDVGLTPQEAAHVVRWPAGELEKTRRAAADAVIGGSSPTFFWTLHDGMAPRATARTGPNGEPQVLFQSPAASLRLTTVNYGEVYVEEV